MCSQKFSEHLKCWLSRGPARPRCRQRTTSTSYTETFPDGLVSQVRRNETRGERVACSRGIYWLDLKPTYGSDVLILDCDGTTRAELDDCARNLRT
jgi:hypothetical protein